MNAIEKLEMERLRYRPGQMLRSRDFNHSLDLLAQRRWWHNRALHNTCGVAFGLDLPVQAGPAEIWLDPDGSIAGGLAYDCYGRELWLQSPARVPPLPRGAGRDGDSESWTLLVSYRPAAQLPPLPGFESVCCGRVESPQFRWKPSRHVEVTDGVPLARAQIDDGRIRLDRTFRAPVQRPWSRPLLGSGSTPPGKTSWQLRRDEQFPWLGKLETAIDTRSAGFSERPCYFVSLVVNARDPWLSLLWQAFPQFVCDASASGLVLRLLVPLLEREEPVLRRRQLPVEASVLSRGLAAVAILWGGRLPDAAGWAEFAREDLHVDWSGVQRTACAGREEDPCHDDI